MCQPKVLAHNEHGYIVLCPQCAHYQLAFGTSAVCFTEAQFLDFRTIVMDRCHNYTNDGFPNRKDISLPLFVTNVQLVVSYTELLELSGLITEAEILLEVDEIISRPLKRGLKNNL